MCTHKMCLFYTQDVFVYSFNTRCVCAHFYEISKIMLIGRFVGKWCFGGVLQRFARACRRWANSWNFERLNNLGHQNSSKMVPEGRNFGWLVAVAPCRCAPHFFFCANPK